MSQRTTIRMTEDERLEFLIGQRKAALATLGGDGFPHLVAMTYKLTGGNVVMTSYAKAQKVVNIERDSRVSVMVDSGNGYASLRGVMIRGRCELDYEADRVIEAMEAIIGEPLSEDGRRRAGKRVVLTVFGEKHTTWDHSKLPSSRSYAT